MREVHVSIVSLTLVVIFIERAFHIDWNITGMRVMLIEVIQRHKEYPSKTQSRNQLCAKKATGAAAR
jgi:hypothetical protein